MIQVAYNESGELVLTTPESMHEQIVINKIDAVYYIGDDSCLACAKIKPQLQSWCQVKKGTIYYLPVSEISESNIGLMKEATAGYYEWNENSSVPAIYFIKEGNIIFCGDQTNAMDYLNSYVEVLSNN